jgi:hypothetical protein
MVSAAYLPRKGAAMPQKETEEARSVHEPIAAERRMVAERKHSQHHVVGPVHVLALAEDDADTIAAALREERDHCSAHRVIIDITDFEGAMSIVLEAAHKSGWDHDIMVRTADQRHLTLDELKDEVESPTS